jgi:hypothetical protein
MNVEVAPNGHPALRHNELAVRKLLPFVDVTAESQERRQGTSDRRRVSRMDRRKL